MVLHPQTHHRRSCKWCGQDVDEFCDEATGLWTYLEPEPLLITADLMSDQYLYRVYQLSRTGWHGKFAPAGRNWRELRETHECEGMPRQRKSSARRERDKKENERKREP